nr:hypothetical protein [Tanacetum cinerariifolium]
MNSDRWGISTSIRRSRTGMELLVNLCANLGKQCLQGVLNESRKVGVVTSTKVISASASMSAIFEKATSASISIATAVTTAATTVVSIDDITLDQALVEIKTSKPKAKGVVIQEPKPSKMKKKDQINFDEQEAKRLQAEFDEQDRLREEKAQQIEYENLAWDNVQAMIDADYKLAARLQAEVQEQLTIKESSRLFVELMDKRKKHFQNLEQKRREENLQPKLKRGIKYDGDDVTIDATPLSIKTPIIDVKIYKEGEKSYFQIFRADGNLQMYLTFSKMLNNFDKENLEVLWRLVKNRFIKSKPVDDMDSFLLNTLKTMFKHYVKYIVYDGDDVTIDATPLSIETPIIDIKIYEEGKKSYF